MITPKFREEIPDDLEPDTLYISVEHQIAIHLCCCGCNRETVTPLNPQGGWTMKYDGRAVTLVPSIKNPCGAHYFIRENKVVWV